MSDGFTLVGGGSDEYAAEIARAVEEIDAAVASLAVRARGKAKAAPKSAPVARGRASGPPREVLGPLPPTASSTGRRYYLVPTTTPPTVACGYNRALKLLGGSWVGHGRIPEGFAQLESAVNAAAEAGHTEVRVDWQ